MTMSAQDLLGTMDAATWATEFGETIANYPDVPFDFEAMRGWFANAIMAGYDAGIKASGILNRD